ncbi:hypothetical protein EG68_03184 [Paragonimus skrjabini miyazakii]|uniref:Peptidase M14 domain-containing protein n=1 Tax=Paragonimus skrjabini miyazakii TaxID=59628 RepID=A0A8S9Z6N1_9TREM|nr:hypothetical protein EG68_03184 [Paragonimus skrjabini miyazakii]
MDCRVGGLFFSSKFDSGNLARVEPALPSNVEHGSTSVNLQNKPALLNKADSNTNNNAAGNVSIYDFKVDYDFKVWTRPDCAGTLFENGNRTWFHFSVRGYAPGKLIRIMIMNLNKQSKVYSQGYAPLYRVCHSTVSQSRWQRIKDRPAWDYVDGQFVLTFVHRFIDPRGSTTYFAFCFPWTYTETQNQLAQLESLFIGQTAPLIAKMESVSSGFVSPTDMNPVANSEEPPNFELLQQVYFHRELLCYSLEGRRIDLLTITSWSGLLNEREDYFDPLLFPDRSVPRPWKFKGKQVVFISARVHPGETPSSHVFNGLLELLLRPNDARSCQLRDQYVFKLIPLLNPDGVVRGHYRTDCRGVNLNRVYLTPDFLYYPSIYATKALLVYHHTKYGTIVPYANFLDGVWEEFKSVTRTPSGRISSNLLPECLDSTVTNSDINTASISPVERANVSCSQRLSPLSNMNDEQADYVVAFSEKLQVSEPPPVIGPTSQVTTPWSSFTQAGVSLAGLDSEMSVQHTFVTCQPPAPSVPSHRSTEDHLSSEKTESPWGVQMPSSPVQHSTDENSKDVDQSTETVESVQSVDKLPPEDRVKKIHSASVLKPSTALSRGANNGGNGSEGGLANKNQRIVSSVGCRLSAISKSCKSSRLLAAFKTRRRPSLKVDCLPCLFTKWNVPLQQPVTGRGYFTTRADKYEQNLAKLTKHIDHRVKLLKPRSVVSMGSTDNFMTTKQLTEQPKSPGLEEADFKQSHLTVNASLTEQNSLKKSEQQKLSTKQQAEKGEGQVVHKAIPHILTQDLYCFSPVDFEPGNEGSEDEEFAPETDITNRRGNEDFSINAQYVDLRQHVRMFVERLKRTSDATSESSTVPSVETILEQLDRLRKGDHMSDSGLRLCNKTKGGIAFYLDLHGHCSKRGCFLYGNWLESEDQMVSPINTLLGFVVNNVLFALLVGANSIHFDFNACNFSVRNMYQRDRRGNLTKEGSGRVAVWKHLGLVHSYTLECNYNTGPLFNRIARCLAAAPPDEGGRLTPPGTFIGPYWTDIAGSVGIHTLSSPNLLTGSNLNSGVSVSAAGVCQLLNTPPRFTPAHYEEVGRALLIATLDLHQTNPWPRIATLAGSNAVPGVGSVLSLSGLGEFANMKSLREWVRKYVRGLANSTAGGPSAQPSKSGNHKVSPLHPSEAAKPTTSIVSSRWPRSGRLCQTRLSAPGSTNLTPASNTIGPSMTPSDVNGLCQPRTASLPGKPCLNPLRSSRMHQTQDIHVIPRTSSIKPLETIEHWSLPSGKLECALTSVVSREAQVKTEKLDQTSTDNSFTPSILYTVITIDIICTQTNVPSSSSRIACRDSHRLSNNGSSTIIRTTNTGKSPKEHNQNIREVFNKKDTRYSSKVRLSLNKPVVGFHVDVTRCFGDHLLSARRKTDRKFQDISRQTDNESQKVDFFGKNVTSLKTENCMAGRPRSSDMRTSEASCAEEMTFRSMATTIYDRKQRSSHRTHRTKSQAFESETHKLNSIRREPQPCGRTHLHTNFSTTFSPESLVDHPTDLTTDNVTFSLPVFSKSESTSHLKGMNLNLRSSAQNFYATKKLTVKPKSQMSSSTKKSFFRKWPFVHEYTRNNNNASKIAMIELTPPDTIRVPKLMTCMPLYSDRCSFAVNNTHGIHSDEYLTEYTKDQSNSFLNSYPVKPIHSCCAEPTVCNQSCNTKENPTNLLAEPSDNYFDTQKHFIKPHICSTSQSAVAQCESQ